LDPPEKRIPWPNQPTTLWPQADISGRLATGEVFIVEVDDQADSVRSVVKYWPLLHAVANGDFGYPPICLVEVSAVCSTYGTGFQLLAINSGACTHSEFVSRSLSLEIGTCAALPRLLSVVSVAACRRL
jgi:hypothetical protein